MGDGRGRNQGSRGSAAARAGRCGPGIGSARGADRAIKAAELAISSPLLEASIDGAQGVLISIQGGSNLGLHEMNDAALLIQEAVHPEAVIIWGTVVDDSLGDEVRVTVISAGFAGGPKMRTDSGFNSSNAMVDTGDAGSFSIDELQDETSWASEPVATDVTTQDPVFDQSDDSDIDIPDFLR